MRKHAPLPAGRRVARAFLVALGVLAALFVIYLAVINALIRTGKLSAMFRDAEERLIVDAGSSFSPWPGHVEARGLSIDYADSNLHLIVQVPNGAFDVDLPALLHRRFHARNITGTGAIVRLRPSLSQLSKERRRALPDVEDVPKRPGPAPNPDDLWCVELSELDADFDEIWISEFRYLGAAHVRGGFEYEPFRRVHVVPSELTLSGGTVHFGSDEAVLGNARGTASAVLVDTTLPADVLPRMEGRATVAGDVRNVRFLSALWPVLHGIHGGAGRIELDAHVAQGKLWEQAKGRYSPRDLTIDRGDRALVLDATLAVDATAKSTLFTARAAAEHAEFRLDGKKAALLDNGKMEGHFTRDLARPKLHRGSITIPTFIASDVRVFERLELLPRDLGLSGGPVSGKLDLDANQKDIDAAVEVDMQGVRMKIAPFGGRIFGHAAGHWQSTRESPFEGTLRNAALSVSRMDLESADRRTRDFKLEVQVPDLRLARDPFRLWGDFKASTPDVRPPIRVAGVVPRLFEGLLPSKSVSVVGTLDLRDGSQVVNVNKTPEGDLQVTGRLAAKPRGTYAAFLIEDDLLNLGVRATPEESSLKIGANADWLREEIARFPR